MPRLLRLCIGCILLCTLVRRHGCASAHQFISVASHQRDRLLCCLGHPVPIQEDFLLWLPQGADSHGLATQRNQATQLPEACREISLQNFSWGSAHSLLHRAEHLPACCNHQCAACCCCWMLLQGTSVVDWLFCDLSPVNAVQNLC